MYRKTKKELIATISFLKADNRRLTEETKALGKINIVDQGKITELEAKLKEETFLHEKKEKRLTTCDFIINEQRTILQIIKNILPKPDFHYTPFEQLGVADRYPETFEEAVNITQGVMRLKTLNEEYSYQIDFWKKQYERKGKEDEQDH
jgi:hypothetical protein